MAAIVQYTEIMKQLRNVIHLFDQGYRSLGYPAAFKRGASVGKENGSGKVVT